MSDPREVYGHPDFEVLFRQARKAVARGQVKLGFKAPTASAAVAVSTLLGSPVEAGVGRTIVVAELDERLRANGTDLHGVLSALFGDDALTGIRPPCDPHDDDVLWSALRSAGLADRAWAPAWVEQVRRYGKVPDLAREAPVAASILATLVLDPKVVPTDWPTRAHLALTHTGDPTSLDRGSKPAALVLRAAALAHGTALPRTPGEERLLWERCGVAVDGLSASVLTWNLPDGLRHHALRDALPAAPPEVWVCESPRVLEALVDADVRHPVVCLSGHLNIAARRLLAHLASAGARVHHHADFDGTGLLITAQLQALTGGSPWRMSARDYREALDLARATGRELSPLDSAPESTAWDPDLVGALRAGWAVAEEQVLPLLVADLVR